MHLESMHSAAARAVHPLLSVRGLTTSFRMGDGWSPVVRDVSFDIRPQETLAVVGESGSGKSVTALSIMRLLNPRTSRIEGEIRFDDIALTELSDARMRRTRGSEIAMIFQDASLNPVYTVGFQLTEVLRLKRGLSQAEALREAVSLLEKVRIPAAQRRLASYPHELSGGMRQRVAIAMALACKPRLLIADEPTTALDVTVQAQILDLLLKLQAELGMALLLITHNLGLVARAAHRVYVMYAGHIVEEGPCEEVLRTPRHPYTQALLRAVPKLAGGGERLEGIAGSVPAAGAWPAGCRFHPRCPKAQGRCAAEAPAWESIGEGGVRCHFWR